jgi:2-isopropylmalate synthase
MERIRIFDTTLRDGEESPGASMTPGERLRMAEELDALGVDVIEAGFPGRSSQDEDAVRRIAKQLRRPVIAALARPTTADIDRAAEALASAPAPRIRIFHPVSDYHLQKKLNLSRDECLALVHEAVSHARRRTDDVEFSAIDATRTEPGFLSRVVETAIDAGATTVNVPDTVGYAVPADFTRIIEMLLASVRGVEGATLSVHCHDDLGLAVANSLAAVQAGARQVHCTLRCHGFNVRLVPVRRINSAKCFAKGSIISMMG